MRTSAGVIPRPSAHLPPLSRPAHLNPGLTFHLYGQLPLKCASPYLNACLTPPLMCKRVPSPAWLHLPKTQSPSRVSVLMNSSAPQPSRGK